MADNNAIAEPSHLFEADQAEVSGGASRTFEACGELDDQVLRCVRLGLLRQSVSRRILIVEE